MPDFLSMYAVSQGDKPAIVDDRPDVLLVLVWPLRNEVLAQLSELRSAGTRFLFPLPDLEEVS